MTKRKRTKKIFVDYNDYKDRPFGLKWGPAFALDELMKVVRRNKTAELKVVKELPIMTRLDIDRILQHAYLKSLNVSIQLNHRDEFGKLYDSVVGQFSGFADETHLFLEELEIEWDTIRHISLVKKGNETQGT